MYTAQFAGFGNINLPSSVQQAVLQASRPVDTATLKAAAVTSGARAAVQARLQPAPSRSSSGKCPCYVDAVLKHVEKQGVVVDAAMGGALQQACASDEAEFVAAMKEQGVSYEACKPFYMRKSTWLIGGAAALALLVLR